MTSAEGKMPRSSRGIPSAPFVAYFATLLLFFIGSFLTDQRTWGVDVWGYLPGYGRYALIAIGAFIGVLVMIKGQSQSPLVAVGDIEWTGRTSLLLSIGFVTTFMALFYLLKTETHFLGDGITLLTQFSRDNPPIKSREIGEMAAHAWAKRLSSDTGLPSALFAYRFVSFLAGFLFLTLVVVFTRLRYGGKQQAAFHALGIVSGGYMLLYFGYVENYSLFCFSVALFTLGGLLILHRDFSRWLILIPTALAIFLHILGITLLPAAVYLLLRDSRLGLRLWRTSWAIRLALAAAIISLVGCVFAYFYIQDDFFRFSIVSPFRNWHSVRGYTLFSSRHLSDIINLLLTLVPGIFVAAAVFWTVRQRELIRRAEFPFLCLLALSTVGASFIFDPKLGMPRDWDLFSFCGIPLAALSLWLIWSSVKGVAMRRAITILFVSLGFLSLGPRVAVLHNPSAALTQVEDYVKLDPQRSRTFMWILSQYYQERGDTIRAREIDMERPRQFPEEQMMWKARLLIDDAQIPEAEDLIRQILNINPFYSDAWANLATCLRRTGRYDSALICIRIGDGLNPYNPTYLIEMGHAYFNLKNYPSAARAWERSASLDSGKYVPLYNLARLWQMLGDDQKYLSFLQRVATRPDAPGAVVKTLGDYYLAQSDWHRAADTYALAVRQGLDTNYVRKLIVQYPQLKGVL